MPISYKTPKGKYIAQKRQAKQRGIEWQLTFDGWMDLWVQSGKWELRGTKRGQYVMGRRGDVGPYSKDNIYICECTQNHLDAIANARRPACNRPPTTFAGVPTKGWTYIAGLTKPYRVSFRRKYRGLYETQEAAEAAYRELVRQHLDSLTPRRTEQQPA
jgi:hypothetical protein